MAVHPRVCGEHFGGVGYPHPIGGSSPRVRGTPLPFGRSGAQNRFIPACAGNTRRVARSPRIRSVHPRVCGEHAAGSGLPLRRVTVHPRVCGEHAMGRQPLRSPTGSSPRVRGTPAGRLRPRRLRRFIPACAGNTTASAEPNRRPAVHPRVCGEHAGELPPVTRRLRFIPACAGNTRTGQPCKRCSNGSSPRVRGTPQGHAIQAEWIRFIPACAGNTVAAPEPCRPPPVHPRVCGEHLAHIFTRRVAMAVHPRVCGEHFGGVGYPHPIGGSSPRVRGTPLPFGRSGAQNRFIPACAGNTRRVARSPRIRSVHPRVCGEHAAGSGLPLRRVTVHPRVCGEHAMGRQPLRSPTGSSPRVRGTLPAGGVSIGNYTGSSPRVRGTRCAWRTGPAWPPVHPRVCGEHCRSPTHRNGVDGSSPRVRGTPQEGGAEAAR